MLGIYIKAGFTCTSCESFIPLNALVETIRCAACGKEFTFNTDSWKSLLEDPVANAIHYEEGEGTRSTIFGDYNYRFEYGKLQPRYHGTKEPIPYDVLLEGVKRGFVVHPQSGERTPVRRIGNDLSKLFPGMLASVDEQTSLLPGGGKGEKLKTPQSSKPVALQCPHCGGSLIVSGSSRNETCRYCGTSVKLPDELWQILHPVPVTEPWYILFDESKIPFVWDSDVSDAVFAGGDEIIIAADCEYSDNTVVARIDLEKRTIWSREDLSICCDNDDYLPGLALSSDGRVLVMHENKRDLYVLSARDGSTMDLIKGLEIKEPCADDQPPVFGMKGVSSMTFMPGGSIMLMKELEDDHRYRRHNELMRFDDNWSYLEPWKVPDEKKVESGFLSRLKVLFGGRERDPEPPYFSDLGDRPAICLDTPQYMVSGSDGTLYMKYNEVISAFDSKGVKLYSVEIPCRWTWGKPVPLKNGMLLVLSEEEDGFKIMGITRTGDVVKVLEGLGEGLDDPRYRAIAATEDKLIAMDYGGEWLVVSFPDPESLL